MRKSFSASPLPSLRLSIIIVNYNSLPYTRECIKSIKSNLKNFPYEIIVVDNNSSGSEGDVIRKEFCEVRLIENKENLGFSKANNQGIKTSRGKYILLLNNDTIVLPGALETMISIMERSPNVGLLGCRLLNADRSVQLSFGKALGIINEFGRKFILNQLLKNYKRPLVRQLVDWFHAKELDVDWVRGACMLIRRDIFVDVGLLDENFFMYFEEVDFGIRIKQSGYRVLYSPDAEIIHYGKGSTTKSLSRATLEYRKSQMYFYKKYYGRSSFILLRIYLFIKIASNIVGWYVDRFMTGENSESLETRKRFNQNLYEIVRNYP